VGLVSNRKLVDGITGGDSWAYFDYFRMTSTIE